MVTSLLLFPSLIGYRLPFVGATLAALRPLTKRRGGLAGMTRPAGHCRSHPVTQDATA